MSKEATVTAKSSSDPNQILLRISGLKGNKILTNSPSDFFKSHDDMPTSHVWSEGYDLQDSTYGTIPYGLVRGSVFLRFGFWATLTFQVTALMATDYVVIKKSIYLSDLILSPLHMNLFLPLKHVLMYLPKNDSLFKKKAYIHLTSNTVISPYWTLNYSTDVNHTNQVTLTWKIRPRQSLFMNTS